MWISFEIHKYHNVYKGFADARNLPTLELCTRLVHNRNNVLYYYTTNLMGDA